MLDTIRKDGGATLKYDTDTGLMIPKRYNHGYQVSERDLLILDADLLSNAVLADIINGVQGVGTKHVGIWLDNNLIYIDISAHWESLRSAVLIGKIHNQKTIYDWENDKCISLDQYDDDGLWIGTPLDFSNLD